MSMKTVFTLMLLFIFYMDTALSSAIQDSQLESSKLLSRDVRSASETRFVVSVRGRVLNAQNCIPFCFKSKKKKTWFVPCRFFRAIKRGSYCRRCRQNNCFVIQQIL